MIFGPSLLLLKRKFFVSPIYAEMIRNVTTKKNLKTLSQ